MVGGPIEESFDGGPAGVEGVDVGVDRAAGIAVEPESELVPELEQHGFAEHEFGEEDPEQEDGGEAGDVGAGAADQQLAAPGARAAERAGRFGAVSRRGRRCDRQRQQQGDQSDQGAAEQEFVVGDQRAEGGEEQNLAFRFPVGDPQNRRRDEEAEGQQVRGSGGETAGAVVEIEEEEQTDKDGCVGGGLE